MEKEKSLSDIMKAEAISLGLCKKWQDEWAENTTKEELVKKYILGISFSLKHNFPSIEFIKREFGEIARSQGIYCDEEISENNIKFAVLNGNCYMHSVTNNVASTIHVRHKSTLVLRVENGARAWIKAHDYANVYVITDSMSKALIRVYGDCNVKVLGNVVVKNRIRYYSDVSFER